MPPGITIMKRKRVELYEEELMNPRELLAPFKRAPSVLDTPSRYPFSTEPLSPKEHLFESKRAQNWFRKTAFSNLSNVGSPTGTLVVKGKTQLESPLSNYQKMESKRMNFN